MQYRPMVRWWWTGLDVTQEELCRELDDMVEGGFCRRRGTGFYAQRREI